MRISFEFDTDNPADRERCAEIWKAARGFLFRDQEPAKGSATGDHDPVTKDERGLPSRQSGESVASAKNAIAGAKNLRQVVAVLLDRDPGADVETVYEVCKASRERGESKVLEAIAPEDLRDRVEAACESVWGGK